jgi:hypothetical protein
MTPAAAIDLAAHGYAVFPCRADKRPACPHGFKDAVIDLDKVRCLWFRHPGPLIGVPTGAVSGLFVLDIDCGEGKKNSDDAADWLDRYALYLPETRRHGTATSGQHFLFRHHEGLRNTESDLWPGVDTRAEGGYFIWWPARMGALADVGEHPIAELPQWLLDKLLLIEKRRTPEPKPSPSITSIQSYFRSSDRGDGSALIKARVEGIVMAMATTPEGQRNRMLFWSLCRLREMLDARKLSAFECNSALRALHGAARRAGLADDEITSRIHRVMRSAAA